MGNIFVTIGKDVEIGAEDLLKWVTSGASTIAVATPGALAAFGLLMSCVESALVDVTGVVENPLNIALDVATVASLIKVWPDLKAFLATLGVKV